MKIALFTRTTDSPEWRKKTLDLDEMPHAGEHIATGSEWYEVLIVGRALNGDDVAARVIALKLTELEIRERAFQEPTYDLLDSLSRYRLVTETEAGKLAGVSSRTIRRLIEKGLLPAHNFGMGRRRVYRVDPALLQRVQLVQPHAPRIRMRRGVLVPIDGGLPTPSKAVQDHGAVPLITPKKRGRPRVLTDEQRAERKRVNNEKWQKLVKDFKEHPEKHSPRD